jgi:hypothetical protein
MVGARMEPAWGMYEACVVHAIIVYEALKSIPEH